MCPQVVDFDADRFDDIVTATFEGHAFVVRGSANGWQQPEHITDDQDRPLVLSLFYDMEANKYDNADRSPEGVEHAGDHCVSATAFDWDNDGDYDMLLGAKEGRLYLRRNEGTNAEPSFAGVNELLEAGGEPFMVKGGLTAARPVDWNNDGLTDLVCGSFKGGVYLYSNTGTKDAPVFAAPEILIDVMSNTADGVKHPNDGVYADPVDYDGDGDLDLLVGGYAKWQPEDRPLTEEETARLAELDKESTEISEKINAFMESVQPQLEEAETDEETQAIWESVTSNEEYMALTERWQVVWKESSELRPTMKREAGVWLYRRK